MTKKLVIAITSAGSGAGKSSRIAKAITRSTINHLNPLQESSPNRPQLVELVHDTSRLPRSGEVESEDYFFASGEAQEERNKAILENRGEGLYVSMEPYRNALYALRHTQIDRLDHQTIGFVGYTAEKLEALTDPLRQEGIEVVTIGIEPPSIEDQQIILTQRGDTDLEEKLQSNIKAKEAFERLRCDFDFVVSRMRAPVSQQVISLPELTFEEAQEYSHLVQAIAYRQAEPLMRAVLQVIRRSDPDLQTQHDPYAEQFTQDVFGESIANLQELLTKEGKIGLPYTDEERDRLASRLNVDPQTIEAVLKGKPLKSISIEDKTYTFSFGGMNSFPGSRLETGSINRVIAARFGSYAEGEDKLTYRLSVRDKDPKIVVAHDPPANSLDVFLERNSVVFDRMQARVQDPALITLEEVKREYGEFLRQFAEKIVRRVYYQPFIQRKMLSKGQFPFVVRYNQGLNFWNEGAPGAGFNGFSIRLAYLCYKISGDERFLEEAKAGARTTIKHKKVWSSHPTKVSVIFSQIIDLEELMEDPQIFQDCIDASRVLADMYKPNIDPDFGYIPHVLSVEKDQNTQKQLSTSTMPFQLKLLLWASKHDKSRDYASIARSHYNAFTNFAVRDNLTLPDLVFFDVEECAYKEKQIVGVPDDNGRTHHTRNHAFNVETFMLAEEYFRDEKLKPYISKCIDLIKSHDYNLPADFFDPLLIPDSSGQAVFTQKLFRLGISSENEEMVDASFRLAFSLYRSSIIGKESIGCVFDKSCYDRNQQKDYQDVGLGITEVNQLEFLIDVLAPLKRLN